ncbi:hypothetical protein Ahy_A06g030965 isoform B [Arachis hypogaea]|uniref:Uncharacterized protein n=1 Tax=Arachis hypogaea TaxID=3818 RepID=A0A445CY13_ARAHY|nr:hypothetical protein Ahy_A06g030965 isoform B [Arachis hypogaea]
MEPQLNQGDDEDKVSGSNSKQSYNFQASNVNPKREKYLRYRTRLNAADGKVIASFCDEVHINQAFEHSSDLQNDEKQRIALGENIMRLMRKLDTIQGNKKISGKRAYMLARKA